MQSIRCLVWSTIAILLLMFQATSRAEVVIDSFTTPQSASIAIGDRNTADGPGIIGGERDFVAFLLMSANGAVPRQLQITSLGGGGADIYYDGNDNDPSSSSFGGMGSIYLTQGGRNDRFRFDFTSASSVPATLTIDVKNFGVGSALQVNLPQSPGIFDVPFASFPSTAVFHTVGYINLHFEIHGEGSFTIDRITATVPEPAALSLILSGSLWLGFYRRRVRRT
jgi:hypothetical protein